METDVGREIDKLSNLNRRRLHCIKTEKVSLKIYIYIYISYCGTLQTEVVWLSGWLTLHPTHMAVYLEQKGYR